MENIKQLLSELVEPIEALLRRAIATLWEIVARVRFWLKAGKGCRGFCPKCKYYELCKVELPEEWAKKEREILAELNRKGRRI